MIRLLMANLSITDEVVVQSHSLETGVKNGLDQNSVIQNGLPALQLQALSHKRLKSDGLSGIVDGNSPVSGKVVVIQEINGLYTEVGRAVTSDGSWEIKQLTNKSCIAIALKDNYNAGVVSGLLPKD